jgi:hypothetical protein
MAMDKKKSKQNDLSPQQASIRLPKDALSRINLGQSFAEYDTILRRSDVFVMTPALLSAADPSRGKLFYVGRRGTGKTAITIYLNTKFGENVSQILPELFSYVGSNLKVDDLRDTRQRPFKSLVTCFKRALLGETLSKWFEKHLLNINRLQPAISRERNFCENYDFDLRMLTFVEEIFHALNSNNEKDWLRLVKRPKDLALEMEEEREGHAWDYRLLIDRIDESWDGSDRAVILLMALMHACVELASTVSFLQPLVFLRENIFERVRQIDNEFARLETAVVSVDWSQELLLEMIERRLNMPFNTKLPLRGPTWDYFFEGADGRSSRSLVFEYCQERPRDVLTYCSFAVESAQAQKHDTVKLEDLQSARRRFSDSRLKDLGDEYQENYPQIQLVLARFYGLGREYTIQGLMAFIKKLLVDDEVKEFCSSWLYKHTSPEQFAELMYNIGFFGIKEERSVLYRSLGAKSPTPPPISHNTHLVIHPSYADALNLQNIVIDTLDASISLRKAGLLTELPGAINLSNYHERLRELQENLGSLPQGSASASTYEDIVGDIIRLCFFHSLSNVEPKVREVEGRVIRDWIASNRASSGFWEMIRQRHQATQIIWECKNFSDLGADVFHQCLYYMTKVIGGFSVICFRGKVKEHYYQHMKRVSEQTNGGVVLLLTDQDLNVFIRQARHGKLKEDHIQDIYDRAVRRIS